MGTMKLSWSVAGLPTMLASLVSAAFVFVALWALRAEVKRLRDVISEMREKPQGDTDAK